MLQLVRTVKNEQLLCLFDFSGVMFVVANFSVVLCFCRLPQCFCIQTRRLKVFVCLGVLVVLFSLRVELSNKSFIARPCH